MRGTGQGSHHEAPKGPSQLIILGIDPGTRVAGFAVISLIDSKVSVLNMGPIRLDTKKPVEQRVFDLGERVGELIAEHSPRMVCVESVHVSNSVMSSMKLKMANAAVIDRAIRNKVEYQEVAPKSAKKAMTGRGDASKGSVREAVQRLCGAPTLPQSDAADAVAIAVCGASKITAKSDRMGPWITSKEA